MNVPSFYQSSPATASGPRVPKVRQSRDNPLAIARERGWLDCRKLSYNTAVERDNAYYRACMAEHRPCVVLSSRSYLKFDLPYGDQFEEWTCELFRELADQAGARSVSIGLDCGFALGIPVAHRERFARIAAFLAANNHTFQPAVSVWSEGTGRDALTATLPRGADGRVTIAIPDAEHWYLIEDPVTHDPSTRDLIERTRWGDVRLFRTGHVPRITCVWDVPRFFAPGERTTLLVESTGRRETIIPEDVLPRYGSPFVTTDLGDNPAIPLRVLFRKIDRVKMRSFLRWVSHYDPVPLWSAPFPDSVLGVSPDA